MLRCPEMARSWLAWALTVAASGCADGGADPGSLSAPAAEASPADSAASNVDAAEQGSASASELNAAAATPPALPDPIIPDPIILDTATYHVPVPSELEPYANFALADLRFRERGGEWTLDYTVPVLLVGGNQNVSFRGTESAPGVYELEGDAGQATCHAEAAGYRCDEVLRSVELDADKLERALGALSAEESRGRRAVASRFADDPIGVLTFPR